MGIHVSSCRAKGWALIQNGVECQPQDQWFEVDGGWCMNGTKVDGTGTIEGIDVAWKSGGLLDNWHE